MGARSAVADQTRVLVVDDEPALLRAYSAMLRRQRCDVQCASSGDEAVQKLDEQSFDVILSDVQMPGMSGLEFLRAVRQRDLDIPVILMTGQPGLEGAMRALEYGAFRYLVKPIEFVLLEEVILRASRLHAMARLKRQSQEVQGLSGTAPGDRAGLETRFAQALDRLWMAYQPIVVWSERRVFGYEALLRSDEPTMGTPGDLLDAAERLGRLHDLGRAIRRRVGNQAAGAPSDAHFFVNLHAADLNDDELYSDDAALCGMADRVVLEVTERASLDNVRAVEQRVGRLRQRRFRIAVDDLGAGYAGLTSFTLLEPAIVKLDMSLVRGIDTHLRKQSIVRAMTRLCGELGMMVVAEGVETVPERDALAGLGCDLLQGYLFARPTREFGIPIWE
jgi:EAL domain-containing protein (putative c-di-GMP-specific phosphodiesterase class I)/ActR/RegA family two-component response regulator